MTIDLRKPEESPWIKGVNRFPDGQVSVELIPAECFYKEIPIEHYYKDLNVIMGSKWDDIQILLAFMSAVPKSCVRNTLYIPYLIGGRSDRQFMPMSTYYLRDVIAPILNSLGFNKVEIEVPHSDVSCAVIHNSTPRFENFIQNVNSIDFDVLVYPDIGAYKRFNSFFIGPHVIIGKNRGVEGKIIDVEILSGASLLDNNAKCLVVDDLCDGGATFIEVAKTIYLFGTNVNLDLYVHHGLFSNGLEELLRYYKRIYTSSTVCTLKHKDLTVLL